MKWTPAFGYKLKQVLYITLGWVFLGFLVELNNAVNYDPATGGHHLYFVFGKNAFEHFVITAIGPLLGGLVAGSFIVFYQREKLKGKTYGRQLLIHTLIYFFFLSLFIVIVGIIGALNNPGSESFWQNFYNDIFSLRVMRLLVTWYFIVILTIFSLDVSERYGSGTLRKLLLGRYHQPVKEERIFMFLDLRASTMIAEKIGEEPYFRMLRFFYQLANIVIINHHGEIYQYVGDEIVVSWEKNDGLRNANCLRCFYAIREQVAAQSKDFLENFGVVPEFKAGIHSGIVATGEIGSIKKDIVYSGDVLNTTARIVARCNQYGEDLIISGILFQELKENTGFSFTFLDSPLLRGKTVTMELYAVRKQG